MQGTAPCTVSFRFAVAVLLGTTLLQAQKAPVSRERTPSPTLSASTAQDACGVLDLGIPGTLHAISPNTLSPHKKKPRPTAVPETSTGLVLASELLGLAALFFRHRKAQA